MLIPMPIVEMPFNQVAMDLVGPLPKSTDGFQYVLVIMNYATHFPGAVQLWSITTQTIADELMKVITHVGMPQEILID